MVDGTGSSCWEFTLKKESNSQDHFSSFVDVSYPIGIQRQALDLEHVKFHRIPRGPTNVSDQEVKFHLAKYLYQKQGPRNIHDIQLHFMKGRSFRADRVENIITEMCNTRHVKKNCISEAPRFDYELTEKGTKFYESHFDSQYRHIIDAYNPQFQYYINKQTE